MAQQKMHYALQKTCSNFQPDAENSSLCGESLGQNNSTTSQKDCEVSSVVLRNSDHRGAILTFFAVGPNGQWRVVALPLQYPHCSLHLGSGAPINMDGLNLVSSSRANSIKVDQQSAQRVPATDGSCSAKPFKARSISGSNFQHQSQNKGFADKEDKTVKRNSRKKVKKKGKRNKKATGGTGFTELESAHGSSTSETACKNGMNQGPELLPYRNGNYFEENSNGNINCSATACTSRVNEVNVLEASVCSLPQNYSSEHHVTNFKSEYPGSSIANGVQDSHCKKITSFRDTQSSIFAETNDSLVLDSASRGSNSGGSCNVDYDFKLSNEGSVEVDIAKLPHYIERKECFPPGNMLNGVVKSYNCAEKTNRQGCTSGDSHLEVPGKREKHINRVPTNSGIRRSSSSGNLRVRSGKENNHSVWQKVQKNDADEFKYELNKVNLVCSQVDNGFKEASLLKKCHNAVDSHMISKSENKDQEKLKVSTKLKRKTSPGSKVQYNSYCRKGSHAIKGCSSLSHTINIPQNEILDTPARMGRQKELNNVSRSHFKTGCPANGFQTKTVEAITSIPVQSSQICSSELEALEDAYTTVSNLNDQTVENRTTSVLEPCNSLDTPELLEEITAVYLHTTVDDGGLTLGNRVADPGKEDSFGAVPPKWMPVEVKNSGLPSSGQPSSLAMGKLDEPAAECGTLGNFAEDELASDPCTLFSSMNTTEMCTGQMLENVSSLPAKDEDQVQKFRDSTPKECCNSHICRKCSNRESKDQNISAFGNYSSSTVWAVNDVYRAQLASEAVQMASGCPIAEFERLLYSASPVICSSCDIASCQTCSHGPVVGASLCRHQTPNMSLGRLWQWYEKHGSCGLEVRTEDFENSKRFGIDRFLFRAYFVPFLSAVQLFRNGKSPRVGNGSGIPGTDAMEAGEMDIASERSSSIGHLPIFSVLIPQPRAEETFLPPRKPVSTSKSSLVCTKDNVSIEPVDSKCSDDLELLFEYFESEPPQHRRPLYEMIQELVRGGRPSQCVYGDHAALNSARLHDLHSKSWYSVAWYPIYRIPDGNFRATFLTYHSLGHLVRRETSDSLCMDIVSPVVGLQSYNAQGECWFQPRNQTANMMNLDRSGILKERLRTLEQTASLMARAVVTKGSQTCVNKQPDYEFFLSRRRCW